MKLVLPLLAAALLLVVALICINAMSGESAPSPALAPHTEEAPAQGAFARARITKPTPALRDSQKPPRSDATLPQAFTASGSVSVIEPDGSITREVNGHFILQLQVLPAERQDWEALMRTLSNKTDGEPYGKTIAIRNGQWEAHFDLNDEKRYEGRKAKLRLYDGAPALAANEFPQVVLRPASIVLTSDAGRLDFEDELQSFAFGDRDVQIIVRRRGLFVLHVVDAETANPLDKITVLKTSDVLDGELPRAANSFGSINSGRIAHDEPSPLELDPPRRPGPWPYGGNFPDNPGVRPRSLVRSSHFVGSPGYAWKLLDLNLAEGETATVRLEPGGDLEVHLQGTFPSENAILRIRDSSHEYPIAEMPIGDLRTFARDGLALGEYELAVEIGSWQDSPVVLAQATLHITAAHLTQITLDVALPSEFQLAPVAGQLVIPPQWELERFSLSLMLLDPSLDGTSKHHVLRPEDLHQLEGSPGTYAFNFGGVQTGRYLLKLSPSNYGFVFDLDSLGRTHLRLELPRPVEVTVRLRNQDNGEIARAGSLACTSVQASEMTGRFLSLARRAPGEDYFRFVAPEGAITIVSATNRYKLKPQSMRAFPGSSFVIDVRPTYKAQLRLMDGTHKLVWPAGATIEAIAVKGQGRLESQRVRDREALLTDAGRYRVSLPEIAGFERHAPIEVEFAAGEMRHVEVQLVRTK